MAQETLLSVPRHVLHSPKSSTAVRSLVESEFQSETTNLPNELSWEMSSSTTAEPPDLLLVARSLPDERSAFTSLTQVEPVATASPLQAERVVRATYFTTTSPEKVVLGSQASASSPVLSPTNELPLSYSKSASTRSVKSLVVFVVSSVVYSYYNFMFKTGIIYKFNLNY